MRCPLCGAPAECDTVDIGVGEQQCGPYMCIECGWMEDLYAFDVVSDPEGTPW